MSPRYFDNLPEEDDRSYSGPYADRKKLADKRPGKWVVFEQHFGKGPSDALARKLRKTFGHLCEFRVVRYQGLWSVFGRVLPDAEEVDTGSLEEAEDSLAAERSREVHDG